MTKENLSVPPEQLRHQAHAGSQAAYTCLTEMFAPLLEKAAHQPHLAASLSDARGEALLAFCEAVHDYREESGVPFAGYAKAKVYGRLRTFFKQERRHWQREIMPEGKTTASGLPFWESLADQRPNAEAKCCQGAAFSQYLHCLSQKQQQLIFLICVLGLTQKEAADRLGISPQSVAATKKRALDTLRSFIHQDVTDDAGILRPTH